METQTNNSSIVKAAAIYGLYLGLTSACITVVVPYLLDFYPSSFLSAALMFVVSLAILVFFIVWGTKKYREQTGGYISYAKALLLGVLMVAFAGIITSVCTALIHMFDPSSTQKQIDASLQMIERMNISEELMEQQRAKIVATIEGMYKNPIITVLKGIQGSLIFGLILCLITSIFTKKNKPVDFE